MMEEIAVMLSLDAVSITSFTMNPETGKYCNAFNNAGRTVAFVDT